MRFMSTPSNSTQTALTVEAKCPSSYPYSPRNGVFQGGKWECFSSEWTFKTLGSGVINFNAEGNDWYIGIFDTPNTLAFKYAIIFAGWSNTQVKIFKNGSFGTAIATANATAPLNNALNAYQVRFSAEDKTISFSMNGVTMIEFKDTVWNAPNAKYYSMSQYSANVVVYEAGTQDDTTSTC